MLTLVLVFDCIFPELFGVTFHLGCNPFLVLSSITFKNKLFAMPFGMKLKVINTTRVGYVILVLLVDRKLSTWRILFFEIKQNSQSDRRREGCKKFEANF